MLLDDLKLNIYIFFNLQLKIYQPFLNYHKTMFSLPVQSNHKKDYFFSFSIRKEKC